MTSKNDFIRPPSQPNIKPPAIPPPKTSPSRWTAMPFLVKASGHDTMVCSQMVEVGNGEYVRYSEYAKLKEDFDKLNDMRRTLVNIDADGRLVPVFPQDLVYHKDLIEEIINVAIAKLNGSSKA
jgi:hypothetical protein